ncbi:MAG: CDGSH iron-sulfur domain-containing protein [Candidatus Altiarchaeia archaeon]
MSGSKKISEPKVQVTKNGPYLVSGGLPLNKEIIAGDERGDPVEWKNGQKYPDRDPYSLCRCGGSKNKPYCDGTHSKSGFDGTETASRKKYSEQAGEITGPELILNDAESFCAVGRFCHRKGGTWDLAEKSGDPECKKTAIQEACDCPSGRLVACDKKSGKPIEHRFEKSISLVEDPIKGVSGPIWLKGGIFLESSDGTKYETRNRVTLCRCGRSANKPFCDGEHVNSGFNDGDESLK